MATNCMAEGSEHGVGKDLFTDTSTEKIGYTHGDRDINQDFGEYSFDTSKRVFASCT